MGNKLRTLNMVRRSIPLFAVAWIAGAGVAQEPPVPVVSERVEVRLAQFDVVVRDRDGEIVRGLRADDFVVLEAGRPLEVAAVDEFGAPAPTRPGTPLPAPPPAAASTAPPSPAAAEPAAPAVVPAHQERRSFVLLFDSLNPTSALRMHLAKRAAKNFVRESVGRDDLVSVYQLDLELRALGGLSGDPVSIAASIDDVTYMPNSTFGEQIGESVLAYRSRAGVDYAGTRLARGAMMESQVLDWQRDHFYQRMRDLVQIFEGLPGRRVLVLLSGGVAMTTPGDVQRSSGGFTANFSELIRELSRNGVTVYSMDLGDDLAVGDVSREVDWRIAAGKIGLDESVLTDLGLDSALSSSSAGARRQVLGVLAGETGGQLLTHSDLERAFRVVQEESSNFYRVSCRVMTAQATGKYRRLEIRTRHDGQRVTARRGRYPDIVPGAAPQDEGSARPAIQFAAIALRGNTVLLPARGADKTGVVVVVEALGPLRFPDLADGGAKLDVDFFVVARAGEAVAGRYERSSTATVPAAGATLVREAFRVEGRLDLAPGAYELQANLRINDPPQLGVWTSILIVPPTPDVTALGFDGLLLAAGGSRVSPLISRPEPASGGTDPLALAAGQRLLPSTESLFAAPGRLAALFWLHGLSAPPEGGLPRFDLTVEVRDTEESVRQVPTKLLVFQPDGAGGHRGLVELDLANLAGGAYTLRLVAATPAGSADTRTWFRVARGESVTSSPAP